MTETVLAIIAMMVALLAAMAIAVGVEAALIAWRDWQRERASWNCEPGPEHRSEGVGTHLEPRP
jgi:hypothetical protein